MESNIISLDEFRKSKDKTTYDSPQAMLADIQRKQEESLEQRMARIRESIKRINGLMEELRKNQQ
jgi:hypothetical protein